MPYESSEDSSNQPDGPMESPRDAPLDPLGPLNRSLRLIELLISPQLPYKSSEDPSNVAIDLMGHLTPPP